MDERDAKTRLLHRLLISYNDFKQAAEFAHLSIQSDYHEAYAESIETPGVMDRRRMLRALNFAMCVAYVRPFSGNDRLTQPKIFDLPERFVRELSNEERELHNKLLELRNTAYGHSDSEAWDLRVGWHRGRAVPLHNDVWAPFQREATKRIQALAIKMRERCFGERRKLEKELAPESGTPWPFAGDT